VKSGDRRLYKGKRVSGDGVVLVGDHFARL